MKQILLLLSLVSVVIVGKSQSSAIYQPKMLHFYWSYDNLIQFNDCKVCDSLSVSVEGASFERISRNQGIVKVNRGTRKTKLYSWCFNNGIKTLIDSIEVDASPLPNPIISFDLGNNVLLSYENGVNQLSTSQIQNWIGFDIKKNQYFPSQLAYEITDWNLEIAGQTYKGTGRKFTKEVKEALLNLNPGEKVILNWIKYRYENCPQNIQLTSYSTFVK